MDNNISTEYTSTGTLVVIVSSASGAIPVENALVTVKGSTRDNSGVITVVTTDRSGRTPRISLPTPTAEQSEKPGNEKPYATYNVEVDKKMYYPQSFTEVPVFAGTTSIQPANIIPVAEFNGETEIPIGTQIREGENPDL